MSTASHAESTSIAQSSHLNVLMSINADGKPASSSTSSKSGSDGGKHNKDRRSKLSKLVQQGSTKPPAGRLVCWNGEKSNVDLFAVPLLFATHSNFCPNPIVSPSALPHRPYPSLQKRHLSIQLEDAVKGGESEDDDEEEEVEAVTTHTDLRPGSFKQKSTHSTANMKSEKLPIDPKVAKLQGSSPASKSRSALRAPELSPSLPLVPRKAAGGTDQGGAAGVNGQQPVDEGQGNFTGASATQNRWIKATNQIAMMNAFQDSEKLREKENAASIEAYIEQICNIYTYDQERNIDEKVISDNVDPPKNWVEWLLACLPGGRFYWERDYASVRFILDPDSNWRFLW